MAALLEQMLSPMANNSTVVQSVQSVVKILPKNETLSQMAKDLGSKLPVNSTKQLVDGTIRQLLPGDTGNILANMVGSFIGLNATRQIASIVNFDPNRPVSEVMTHVMGILQQCDKGSSSVTTKKADPKAKTTIADSKATTTADPKATTTATSTADSKATST